MRAAAFGVKTDWRDIDPYPSKASTALNRHSAGCRRFDKRVMRRNRRRCMARECEQQLGDRITPPEAAIAGLVDLDEA